MNNPFPEIMVGVMKPHMTGTMEWGCLIVRDGIILLQLLLYVPKRSRDPKSWFSEITSWKYILELNGNLRIDEKLVRYGEVV